MSGSVSQLTAGNKKQKIADGQDEEESGGATSVLKYMEKRLMNAFLSKHEKERLVKQYEHTRANARLTTKHQQKVSKAAWEAVYRLKDVSEEHQKLINKFNEANWTKYYEKGEQIHMRNLEDIMEDRMMSVKRATELPEEFVSLAMKEYSEAKEKHKNKAIQ
jgi:outer membrane translocation and assembly module TamA